MGKESSKERERREVTRREGSRQRDECSGVAEVRRWCND